MIELRPYQQTLKNNIYTAFQQHVNVIAVAPTGAGKTAILASIFNDYKSRPSVAMAHRQELVTQISCALAENSIYHKVIASKSVVAFCIQQHIKKFGKNFHHDSSPVAVASVQTINRRAESMQQWCNSVELWAGDECFTAGTMVDNKPIEYIIEGDEVTAFNEHTGGFDKKRVVKTFKNPIPNEMVKISTPNTTLICTLEHPIWTNEGWVNAGRITERHMLHLVQIPDINDHRKSKIPLAKKQSNILLRQKMQLSMACVGRSKTHGKKNQTENYKTVSNLWNSLFSNVTTVAIRQDVLQHKVFKHQPFNHNGKYKSKIRLGAYVETKPYAKRGNTFKGIRNIETNRSQTFGARRERKTFTESRSALDINACGSRICKSSYSVHPRGETKSNEIPHSLQTRSRSQRFKNRNRNRRRITQFHISKKPRQQENKFSTWVKVDSVEIHKSTSDRKYPTGDARNYVYNIEVEDFNTYTANGVVVHNCHHYTSENTFGAATKLFPRAHGLGVTATPMRCDKKPLGRIHGGLFDFLVNGPSPRDLINAGYLCEYRIFAPPQSIDLSAVDISPNTREYSPNQLRETAHSDKSTITGDIVETYLKRVPGKRAIAFLIDVEDAKRTADKFNAAGVPAFAVDAKTPDNIRQDAIERFKRGDYKVLCNVDLFGEGFDVPNVEVVFMGRPTQSFGLYSQQFGRMMRTVPDKTHGILFDHVGNVKRHGLPDREMHWTLDIDERGVAGKRDPNAIPMRTCSECFFAYEALSNTCPYCGHVEIPESRGAPMFVDGDLEEFSPELLAKLRGDVVNVLEGGASIPHGAQEYVERRLQRLWGERQETVRELQNCIDYWAGIQTTVYDRSINECYRIFYHKFGVDTLTAQGMPRPEMNLLLSKIREEFV